MGDFNEDLLNDLSDATGGRPLHVVTEKASGAAIAITDLPDQILAEFLQAQQEAGENLTSKVDREVMGYMQQCNIVQMINNATRMAEQNPQRAAELIETAQRITKQIGNEAIASSLTVAKDELRRTRKISAETRKTIKMGSKDKTFKMESDINNELEEEEIRKASGT